MPPAPDAEQRRFGELLERLLRLDTADLDFGLYRIQAQRRDELQRFITTDLLPRVDAAVDGPDEARRAFSHLNTFFSRYYEDGHFSPRPRYRGDAYAVPYDGREVHLHWAHSDQLYIKSGDRHVDYAAHLPPTDDLPRPRLELRLAAAQTDRDDTQSRAKRRTVLRDTEPVQLSDDRLTLWFEHRAVTTTGRAPSQSRVNASTIEAILPELTPAWAALLTRPHRPGAARSLLAHHLAAYTRRRTTDHFVHPDLGGFLRRELQRFIAEEVLLLDELVSADALAAAVRRVEAVRTLAGGVIDWLAQVEDLHHALATKPRFVLTSRWLVPTPDGIVDTAGWTPRDTWDLLARTTDDVSRSLAGVLVHGNNRDATTLFAPRLRGQVQGVYLDPPYNTGDDGFLYRDGYRHATWLTLMQQVLAPLTDLATDEAFVALSINDNELVNLAQLGTQLLGESALAGLYSVKVRHAGRILTGAKEVQEVLEYLLLFRLGPAARVEGRWVRADAMDDYVWTVRPTGPPDRIEQLDGRRVAVYTLDTYVLERSPPSADGLKRTSIRGTLRKGNSSGRFYVRHIEPSLAQYQGCLLSVEGIGADGLGARWFWVPSADHRRRNPDYFQGVPLDRPALRRVPLPNFIDLESSFNRVAAEGGVTFRDGKKPQAFLDHVFHLTGVERRTEGWVVDLFGGSGSTAHAVIRANTRDDGRRQYLLTEIGEYVHTITIPRLIAAATDAQAERSAESTAPLLQQVVTLETLDDTLDAVQLRRDPGVGEVLAADDLLRRDYTLRYLLQHEARRSVLDLDRFEHPWQVTIATRHAGDSLHSPVDLVETSVLLLGLSVHRYDTRGHEDLVLVWATDPSGQRVLLVWRDCDRWPAPAVGVLVRAALDERGTVDLVYGNGDHRLESVRSTDESWRASAIEEVFRVAISIDRDT
ncbi:MAG: adenine-specific DNA-methyltransferase [Myxococcota bacterium]|jgi:adenine-specific DNA-methyltransferase